MAYNSGVSLQQTRDEIGYDDSVRFIPRRFNEQLAVFEGPTKQETQNLLEDDDGFLLESAHRGILGENTLGTPVLSTTLFAVYNYNDEFIEKFRNSEFVDTTNTTGIIDTTYPGKITLSSGSSVYQSLEAYYDSTSSLKVQSVIITADTTGDDTITFSVSHDASTWQTIPINTRTTLTNQGYKLFVKAEASGIGSWGVWGAWGNPVEVTISNLRVKYYRGQ